MIGKTKDGFQWEISEEAADDWELLENISKLDNEDISVMSSVMDSLFGKEQKKRLYNHYRGENGRVSARKMLEVLGEVFHHAEGSVKN